jgi:hypothetical protein
VGNEELVEDVGNGYKVSVWEDEVSVWENEKVLEMDDGDVCT